MPRPLWKEGTWGSDEGVERRVLMARDWPVGTSGVVKDASR